MKERQKSRSACFPSMSFWLH